MLMHHRERGTGCDGASDRVDIVHHSIMNCASKVRGWESAKAEKRKNVKQPIAGQI
jgi:hypothetical protein